MTRPAQRHEGFSLWIPLLFTAILTMMVAGVNALMGKMQQAAVSATRTQIDGAYQAVIGFAAANRRLPSAGEFAALIKDLRDVHGQPLVYLYDNAFIDAAPDICRRSSAVITVNQCGADANCAAPAATANVAFAILGGGTVRSGDTAAAGYPVSQSFTSGTAGLAAASIIRNYTAGFAVGDYATPAVDPYAYDDEMRFADVATLRQKAGCQGSQVRIVNNELPRGTVGQAYNATIFADGGVGAPPYLWCVETTSAASTGNLPPGISSGAPVRNPAGAGTSCMGPINPLARASWSQSASLALTGTPTTAGTYAVIFHAQDNNSVANPGALDSSTSKRLTITIADTTGCPAGQFPWTVGGATCSAAVPAGTDGQNFLLNSTEPGTAGSASVTCSTNSWTTSSAACVDTRIVGGTPITLNAATITAACSGVCSGSGIDTGVTTLALAGPPALVITASGGTIGRNQGGAATDAIGVYQGSGGAPDTALQTGESLSFKLTGKTAEKFAITLYGFSGGERAWLTFKRNGANVATHEVTATPANGINPGGVFDEVVVQAIDSAAFWVQTIQFCDAVTACTIP